MKSTLEPPKPTTKHARCQTPFREKNGDCSATLGNPRWHTIPAFPTRQRAQEVVLDTERTEAARILKEFIENEEIARRNDVSARTNRILDLERSSSMSTRSDVAANAAAEAEQLRREREKCNHAAYLGALAENRILMETAAKLIIPILDRLVVSFDDELNTMALAREADMERLGLQLSEERNDGTKLFIGGLQADIDPITGHIHKSKPNHHWALWDSRECTMLHSCREITRNLRQKFDSERGKTHQETLGDRAIPSMVFLCTGEQCPSFSWV